jgi:hypothetical protein
MKSVIILKSRGNRLFFAMLDAKTSSISSCVVPVHLLPYEDYIVHGHPKDQRGEYAHIKGTLNLPFLGLILALRSLAHKMSKYEVGAHSPCQSQSALTNTPVGHSIHRMVFAFFSSTSSPCINQHCITINFFFLLLI